jgi:hypothetical protein
MSNSVFNGVADFGQGIWEGGSALVGGVGHVLKGAADLAGLSDDPESVGEQDGPTQQQQAWDSLKATTGAIVDHPGKVWDAMKKPYVEAWDKGDYARLAGRATFDVATLAVGGGAVGAAIKGAGETSEAASVLARAAAATGEVGTEVAGDATTAGGTAVSDAAAAANRAAAEGTTEASGAAKAAAPVASAAERQVLDGNIARIQADYAEAAGAESVGGNAGREAGGMNRAVNGVVDKSTGEILGFGNTLDDLPPAAQQALANGQAQEFTLIEKLTFKSEPGDFTSVSSSYRLAQGAGTQPLQGSAARVLDQTVGWMNDSYGVR